MLGWLGVCYQFIEIKNYVYQQDMMIIDGYDKVEVDQDSQLFIYSFPREDCIRLDELLKSIRSDYVKIYGAQALKLIQAIILHHDKFRKTHRFHGNLTTKNVWIVFNKQSGGSEGRERLRCIFSKLSYKIHFINYSIAPQNDNNECSQIVTNILNVLDQCQSGSHQNKQSNKEMNLEKLQQKLLPYAQEQQKLFIQIDKIFQEHSYIENEQKFKYLDSEQYDWIRSGKIYQEAAKTIKQLFQLQPPQLNRLTDKLQWRAQTITQEIQFWELLPRIVRQCESIVMYEDPIREVSQTEPYVRDLIQRIYNLKSLHYGSMLSVFQKQLNKEQNTIFSFVIKMDQKVTEPHFMNLFTGCIAQYLNDLDSFKRLNNDWLQNQEQFESKSFQKHTQYLILKYQELLEKEEETIIAKLQ